MRDLNQAETPELVNILRNYNDYDDADVKHAFRILKSRGVIVDAIKQLRKEVREGKIEIDQGSRQEPYRDFNPSNPVVMRTGSTQQLVFEQKLMQAGIPYHRQEGLDVIVPLVNYYFNDHDRARADKLEIEANDYVEKLPPDRRNKTTKTALKGMLWVILFFGVFLLISVITKLL